MALNKISQNELFCINKENFNNFYRFLYGSGDIKRICQKLDDFVDNNVQDDRLKIKQIILDEIASNFQRYFFDVVDYATEPAKYHSFDEEWHKRKLQDSLTPYFYVFKNFLKGLDFDKQKDWLRECFDLACNQLDYDNSFKNDFINLIMSVGHFDILLEKVLTCIKNKVCDRSANRLEHIQILTQLFEEAKCFLLKRALHERGFINLQSDEILACFVHFTDEDNLDSILKNGILSLKEIEKRGIASKTNDERRLDRALDYISISIKRPNKILLNDFKNKGSIKKPIYIYLNPFSVLSFYGLMDIIFCDKNAAARACEKGNSWLDFENIFAPSKQYQTTTNSFSYNRQGKEKYEPTDRQAEILVQNCIPENAIAFILDSNNKLIFERKK